MKLSGLLPGILNFLEDPRFRGQDFPEKIAHAHSILYIFGQAPPRKGHGAQVSREPPRHRPREGFRKHSFSRSSLCFGFISSVEAGSLGCICAQVRIRCISSKGISAHPARHPRTSSQEGICKGGTGRRVQSPRLTAFSLGCCLPSLRHGPEEPLPE